MLLFLFSLLMTTLSPSGGNFHQFQIEALNGDETINMANFKGKKLLVVNVASKCGYTSQYEGLQQLYTEYQDELVIIGFPCNQFLGQEPGSEAEIAQFCKLNYGVTFPLTTKIKVKGNEQHPIYQWLTQQSLNGVGDYKVKWNFNKFLIDEEGQLIGYFPSSVKPFDDELVNLIK